ncbi:MAG: c-type cytochrome biogenesis protein CcmI [Rhodospirillales bacterium]
MTGLIVAMAVLAAIVGLVLARPLLRRNIPPAARAEYDLTVFRDQLKEIERDAEGGLLDDDAAEAARVEVQRRMLAADEVLRRTVTAEDKPGTARVGFSGVLIAAGVPFAAAAMYVVLGSPDQPNQPFAARDIPAEQPVQQAARQSPAQTPEQSAQQQAQVADMNAMIERLAESLRANPDNVEGWLLLGQSLISVERFEDAKNAYARARKIAQGRPDVDIAYAEALILMSGMKITEEAAAVFQGVRERSPFEPKSRYYLALKKAQADDVAGALQGWADLVAISDEGAPWVPLVRQQIARAAEELKIDPTTLTMSDDARELIASQPPVLRPNTPIMPPEGADPHAGHPHAEAEAAPDGQPGPTREQMEAAQDMSAEDRAAMIRGMVQRLADRMRENPDDLAGWQRLEKAYRVLGETAKADEAAAHIKRLSP